MVTMSWNQIIIIIINHLWVKSSTISHTDDIDPQRILIYFRLKRNIAEVDRDM